MPSLDTKLLEAFLQQVTLLEERQFDVARKLDDVRSRIHVMDIRQPVSSELKGPGFHGITAAVAEKCVYATFEGVEPYQEVDCACFIVEGSIDNDAAIAANERIHLQLSKQGVVVRAILNQLHPYDVVQLGYQTSADGKLVASGIQMPELKRIIVSVTADSTEIVLLDLASGLDGKEVARLPFDTMRTVGAIKSTAGEASSIHPCLVDLQYLDKRLLGNSSALGDWMVK